VTCGCGLTANGHSSRQMAHMTIPGHAAPPARPQPTDPLRVPRPAVPRWACVDAKPPRPVHDRWSRLSPWPTVPRSTAPCSSGTARARPTVPVGPAAGRTPQHAARCRSCGIADGVVNQDGPSGTAHGCSELVKAHTARRGRHSCRNKIICTIYPDLCPESMYSNFIQVMPGLKATLDRPKMANQISAEMKMHQDEESKSRQEG
jgi:hypothetical protein